MDIAIVCNQIKLKLKEKQITQDEFAQVMSVSSPTIKRWLKGDGLLFKDLSLMLEKLQMKLSDLALLAEGELSYQFTYTKEQEDVFCQVEGLLAFFDQLLKKRSPKQIAKNYKLTDKSLNFYLSKLDKLKLIEWRTDNNAKLLVSGEPSWINNGPLSQKFRKQIMTEHIQLYLNNRDNLKIAIYDLSPDSYKKINDKYQELVEYVRTLEIKDSNSSQAKKLTTLILGRAQNDISLLTKIPNY